MTQPVIGVVYTAIQFFILILHGGIMSFVKSLAYVAAGVGAVVLAPVTGGSSLAVAIGALGTTTALGAAIGAGVGATAALVDMGIVKKLDEKEKAQLRESNKRKTIQLEMTNLEDMLMFEYENGVLK
ncbi:MAG: hypothetical protein WCI06_07935 [Methylococcaceae bacterium]